MQFSSRLTPFGSVLHGLVCALGSHVTMLSVDLGKVDCKVGSCVAVLMTCVL